jgi:hypothetical protein
MGVAGADDENLADNELSAADVAAGRHRELVGGRWEEIGSLQLEFLRNEGLRPDHRLLDVGCGCLRGGVRLAAYLAPRHYYGIDRSGELLRVGWEVELAATALQERVPREHLLRNDRFEAWRFGVAFDVAIAQSLFTHLPPAAIRRCLSELPACMAPGARFYATFFEAPTGWPAGTPIPRADGFVSYGDRDPYHYTLATMRELGDGLPWALVPIGDWGHPRGQRMLRWIRLPPAAGDRVIAAGGSPAADKTACARTP